MTENEVKIEKWDSAAEDLGTPEPETDQPRYDPDRILGFPDSGSQVHLRYVDGDTFLCKTKSLTISLHIPRGSSPDQIVEALIHTAYNHGLNDKARRIRSELGMV